MDIAQMVVVGEVDLIMGFPSNRDLILLRENKTKVLIGTFYNLKSHKMFIGHIDFELVGADF